MKLRAATPADAAALCAIYAPYVADSHISFETVPPDEAEMRRRIGAGGDLYPWLVAEEEQGEVLGYAYACAFRPRAAYRFAVETSVYSRGDQVSRGIGRALYERLLKVLRDQGFTEAIAAISLPNLASVRLHEKLGFTHAGTYRRVGYKLGAWHDVGLWQCALAPGGEPPDEPRALAAVDWPGAYLE